MLETKHILMKTVYKNKKLYAFPVFISLILWNMCENHHYESVYFCIYRQKTWRDSGSKVTLKL